MDAFDSSLQPQNDPRTLTLGQSVLLLLFGVVVLGANLGGSRVLTYHETLFAQPAREMVRSGDWIIPTICGIPSCHKPPMTYWVLAAAMCVFQSESEWVVRLPILLATLATALIIAHCTARWHGRQAGFWAGLVQLSSFYVLMQGRLAESDMLFCLAITSAMIVFAIGTLHASSKARFLAWVYYGLIGIAFLIKGPLGIALIGGGSCLFLAWERQKDVLRFLLSPTGWMITAIICVSWPIAAYLKYPAIVDDWYMHNIDRFNGGIGGAKPPLFYFYMTPLMLLPWTPFAIAGLWHRDAETQPFRRLLLCWFAAGFVLLSLSVWKHKHYLIPLLPPFSVFAGVGLARFRGANSSRFIQAHPLLAPCMVIALGMAGSAASWTLLEDIGRPVLVILAVLTLGLVLAVVLEAQGRRNLLPGTLVGTTGAVAVSVFFLLMPHFDSYVDQTRFAENINHLLPDDTPLQVVALPENQIVYYLDHPLVREDDSQMFLERAVKANSPMFVLAPEHLVDQLQPHASAQVLMQAPTIRKIMTEKERLTLLRIDPVGLTSHSADLPSR